MKKRSAPKHAPRAPERPAATIHGAPLPSEAARRIFSRVVLALAAVLAAALLAMVFGAHKVGDYMTETDFYGSYAEGARLIQRGQLVPARYGVVGPVYELTLALVGFVVRDLFLAAQLISVAATVATLLLWHALIRRFADARVAFAAALFLAANGFFFRYGYSATTDALALALQALALHRLLARDAPRARDLAFAGAFAALAFLTRYSAVALLASGIACIAFGAVLVPDRRRAALLFAAGFLALVGPWVAYSLAHGAGFSGQLHHNIAYEVFARAKGITWDDYQRTMQPQFKSLWDVIARDPGAVFSRMAFNAFDHLRLDARLLLGWPVAITAALGILIGARAGRLGRMWPLWLAAALAFLALVPAFHSERYSLAVLPAYAALAGLAAGAFPFAFPLRIGSARLWTKAALALFPLAFSLAQSKALQARAVDQLPVEVLQAGETLRGLRRPGDRLIARKGHVAYYGGVEPLGFPFADSLPALAAAARQAKARWLWFSWPEAETRPRLFYLLDTTGVVPGLTPRRVTSPHPGVLYEIGPEFGVVPAWVRNDTLLALHTVRGRLLVNPGDGEAWYGLAVIQRSRGELGAAQRSASNAARFQRAPLEALLLLGTVRLDLGDAGAAREAFGRAVSAAPNDRRGRLGLGWAYVMNEDYPHAAEEWRRVVNLTNDPGTLRRMLALFLAVHDDEAAAAARSRLASLGVAP